jgi:hypothetical protein
MFLRNTGEILPNYTASRSTYSLLWEHQIPVQNLLPNDRLPLAKVLCWWCRVRMIQLSRTFKS